MATYAGHTYTNGQVPAAILAELDPPGRHGTSGKDHATLRADAAAAWNRARADVLARTGLSLTVRGWNRSLDEQVTFFHRSYMPQKAGGTDARTYLGVRYVRRPGKAATAIPGRSNHGWALAIDVIDFGAAGQWNHPRRARAMPILAEHGWTDTEGRQAHVDEPWHLVYDPARDQHRNRPAPTTPAPAPVPDVQEDDMFAFRNAADGKVYIVNGGVAAYIPHAGDLAALIKRGDVKDPVTVNPSTADAWLKAWTA